MIALSLASFSSSQTNSLKLHLSSILTEHRNEFLTELNTEIKLRSPMLITFSLLLILISLGFHRCVLINGERISVLAWGSTKNKKKEKKKAIRDLNLSAVRPCPKACFHFLFFFLSHLFFPRQPHRHMSQPGLCERHLIITRSDLHAGPETVSLSHSAEQNFLIISSY